MLEVPVDEVAQEGHRRDLLGALRGRLVDALEHEVAQLVHHLQRRRVHLDPPDPQRRLDHRLDHATDPAAARRPEALDDACRQLVAR